MTAVGPSEINGLLLEHETSVASYSPTRTCPSTCFRHTESACIFTPKHTQPKHLHRTQTRSLSLISQPAARKHITLIHPHPHLHDHSQSHVSHSDVHKHASLETADIHMFIHTLQLTFTLSHSSHRPTCTFTESVSVMCIQTPQIHNPSHTTQPFTHSQPLHTHNPTDTHSHIPSQRPSSTRDTIIGTNWSPRFLSSVAPTNTGKDCQ